MCLLCVITSLDLVEVSVCSAGQKTIELGELSGLYHHSR
jgi:hypothetical protein